MHGVTNSIYPHAHPPFYNHFPVTGRLHDPQTLVKNGLISLRCGTPVLGNVQYTIRQQDLDFKLLFVSCLQNITIVMVSSAAIYIVNILSMPAFFMHKKIILIKT